MSNSVNTVQGADNEGVFEAYTDIPYAVLEEDLTSSERTSFFSELSEIKNLYKIYKKGADFTTEGANGDYIPSDIRYRKVKSLIDKEARFMFSKTPDISVVLEDLIDNEKIKNDSTTLNNFLTKVLDKNHFSKKLVKASKDCFIAKRVACVLNFNDNTGIDVGFLNSLEFYYEADDADNLTKIIAFFVVVDSPSNQDRRIKKKVYDMEGGICYVTEKLYDGAGNEKEVLIERTPTKFTYIPATVILNDGLTGDRQGESEANSLTAYEKGYSKLANADIDAGRKGMNATKYVLDGSVESTQGLSSAPGALWDIQSDQNGSEPKKASVGLLEPSMLYSEALKTTMDRLDTAMHDLLEIPNISGEQLQGVITSGKTLKALYWGLIVRCDEKMLTWIPAIQFIAKTIIDGAKLYPNTVKHYLDGTIPDIPYTIEVENNYPLPEDEAEEKQLDLAEVNAQTMSRKSYMKRWRKLTDKEADLELEQIAKEKQLLEDSYIDGLLYDSEQQPEE